MSEQPEGHQQQGIPNAPEAKDVARARYDRAINVVRSDNSSDLVLIHQMDVAIKKEAGKVCGITDTVWNDPSDLHREQKDDQEE